jgi:hypothetical protein
LTNAEQAWIKYFQVALAATLKHVATTVNEQMASVDWSSAAQEYYVANRSEFQTQNAISVRTLLISTETRSALEALTLADELTATDMTIEQFEGVVREHTEDPSSEDGQIPKLTRGMTVREFEVAAFSLEEVGQLSEPVLSMYGAHVIQLLGRDPADICLLSRSKRRLSPSSRKSVLPSLVNSLKPSPIGIRQTTLLCVKRSIDQFLEEVAAQHKASMPQLPTP